LILKIWTGNCLVDKIAAVNASPLIFFSRAHHIELLHNFARQIYVPEPVAAEIKAKGSQDITARVLNETPWLEVVRDIHR
jgi:predicted nucleic acid-binding protein